MPEPGAIVMKRWNAAKEKSSSFLNNSYRGVSIYNFKEMKRRTNHQGDDSEEEDDKPTSAKPKPITNRRRAPGRTGAKKSKKKKVEEIEVRIQY